MTDFTKTLIRCSSIGLIMAAPQGNRKSPMQKYEDAVLKLEQERTKYYDMKNKQTVTAIKKQETITQLEWHIEELEKHKDDEILSEGCKTYLKEVYAWQKYGKKPYFQARGNKFTEKGILAEDQSLDILSKLDGYLYVKNDLRLSNEYITGEIDTFQGESIINAEKIIDVKSSWDIKTFFANLGEELDTRYWWQMQGYLALTGCEVGEINYILPSMPETLFNGERDRLLRSMEVVTEEDEAFKFKLQDLIRSCYFEDMPLQDRRIKFVVERDDESIAKIYKKVEKCREYLEEIENMHLGVTKAENIII